MKKLLGIVVGTAALAVSALGSTTGANAATAPSVPEAAPSAAPTPAPATTAAPAPATPAPATTAPPPPPPPPTTIPYYKVVEAECAELDGDDELATRLEDAKKNGGSSHLVSMARSCGVQFADDAEQDPKLNRPRSNLEYAVYTGDDPFYTAGWDDVTANEAQILIVIEASNKKWYEAHPTTLPPTTTAAPVESDAPASTEASTAADGTVTIVSRPSTTDSDDDEGDAPLDGAEEDEGSTSDAIPIMGLLLLGAGAVSWGVYGVREGAETADPDQPADDS